MSEEKQLPIHPIDYSRSIENVLSQLCTHHIAIDYQCTVPTEMLRQLVRDCMLVKAQLAETQAQLDAAISHSAQIEVAKQGVIDDLEKRNGELRLALYAVDVHLAMAIVDSIPADSINAAHGIIEVALKGDA